MHVAEQGKSWYWRIFATYSVLDFWWSLQQAQQSYPSAAPVASVIDQAWGQHSRMPSSPVRTNLSMSETVVHMFEALKESNIFSSQNAFSWFFLCMQSVFTIFRLTRTAIQANMHTFDSPFTYSVPFMWCIWLRHSSDLERWHDDKPRWVGLAAYAYKCQWSLPQISKCWQWICDTHKQNSNVYNSIGIQCCIINIIYTRPWQRMIWVIC